jgi:hypothetical protein
MGRQDIGRIDAQTGKITSCVWFMKALRSDFSPLLRV